MSKTSTSSRTNKPILRRKGSAVPEQTTVSESEPSGAAVDADTRRAMIAEAAYYRAERRGFAPGFETEDWLLSEIELDSQAPTQIQRESLEKSTSRSAELH